MDMLRQLFLEVLVDRQKVRKMRDVRLLRAHLLKELQALALDVKVLDENGEEVDLKEDYDDEPTVVPADDKAFTNVNDAESSEGYNVDEDSLKNDIYIRENTEDDDSYYAFDDEDGDNLFSAEDLGMDFSSDDSDDDNYD